MPEPIWSSLLLIAYAGLAVSIGIFAIAIRLFRLQPKSERAVANAQVLVNLKKVFGLTTIGMFLFQFIYIETLFIAEGRLSKTEFNVLSWIFFFVLTSAFYMFALWLLAVSLARSFKNKTIV